MRAVMHMADPLAETVTFGTGEPQEVDSFGLVNERGMFWLAQAVPSEEVIEKKRRKNDPAPEPVPTMAKKLMPADALKIRGQHNASNALAALALCRAIGLPFAPLLHGLREYQGEPHRVELITAVNEVEYYDDSKGTNVGATVAAIVRPGQGVWRCGTAPGADRRRRRQGPGFLAAGRTGVAPCARRAADRPRCAGAARGAGAVRRGPVRLRQLAGSGQAAPAAWRRPAMRCCCRPPAPAWTCSRTMRTARRCLSTPCATSPWKTDRISDGLPAAIRLRFRLGCQAAGRPRAAVEDDGLRPAADLGGAAADVAGHGDGVFGVDLAVGRAQVRRLHQQLFRRAPGAVHRRVDHRRRAGVPHPRRHLAKDGAVAVHRHPGAAGDGA